MIMEIQREVVKFKCPGCGKIKENTDNTLFFKCECEVKITQEDRIK